MVSHNSISSGSKVGCVEVNVDTGVSVVGILSLSCTAVYSAAVNETMRKHAFAKTVRISNLDAYSSTLKIFEFL